MTRLENRCCSSCARIYEVLVHNGAVLRMEDDGPPECPECEAADFTVCMVMPRGFMLGGEAGVGRLYPYYDRALKRTFNSHTERAAHLKATGLVEGGIDFDAEDRQQGDLADRVRREHLEYVDRFDNDPAFADARRLRDRGYFEDEARRQLAERRARRTT